jgi:hypothetical protein
MKLSIDNRTEVIESAHPSPGKEIGCAGVFVIQVLQLGPEIKNWILASPIGPVVTAKEVYVAIYRLQIVAIGAKMVLLM